MVYEGKKNWGEGVEAKQINVEIYRKNKDKENLLKNGVVVPSLDAVYCD